MNPFNHYVKYRDSVPLCRVKLMLNLLLGE